MKKFNSFLFSLVALFAMGSIVAQDTLDVAPGLGTLNAAITANGGDKIYKLQAGQWYGLDAVIENVDYHLQIVGEMVDIYHSATMPATLQTGTTAEGAPFPRMFDAKGDITLKNVYFVNADLNGQIPGEFLTQSDSGGAVIIDNCVIDPMGQTNPISMTGGFNDLWFTNNIACRHGHQIGANDGHLFVIAASAAPGGADTVYIENNTFVSIGMNWLSGSFADQINHYIFINHNTLIHSKSQMDWSILEDEYYLTNNLWYDFMTSGYSYAWQPMPGGDIAYPKPMLIYSDTIPGEALPTERIAYIQYNSLFRHEYFYDLMTELNSLSDTLNKINLHPFIWDGLTDPKLGADPADAFAASREGHLYNHSNNTNTDFPNWKYGNYVYDLDPVFTDIRISELSDSLLEWQRPATKIHALGLPSTDFPEPSTWAKWHWDPDGDPSNNLTWPLFDGTYSESNTMEWSIAGLPLGDLNWWPEKKALWEANKDAIYAHMKAGNTDRMSITSVRDLTESGSSFSKVYPNPISTNATIEFTLEKSADVEISVYNPIGQRVRVIMNEYRLAGTHMIKFDRGDLQHGVYFYTIRAGNRTESHKMILAQ
jgi:hypothetical protein